MRLQFGRDRHFFFFFFNDTATTEIYTLSLHDALPISPGWTGSARSAGWSPRTPRTGRGRRSPTWPGTSPRSEEHTSELQSQFHLVCRLLLEKKKKTTQSKTQRTHKNRIKTHEKWENDN